MRSLFARSELFDLIERVEQGQRLDEASGLRLLRSQDVLALGYMANVVRERKNGNRTFFKLRREINGSHSQEASLNYGKIESAEERLGEILKLRDEQDRSGKYLSFIPFSDSLRTDKIDEIAGAGTATGLDDLKILAVARILLDNIQHIKAPWVMLGPKLTQVSLAFGVDYVDYFAVKSLTKPAVIRMILAAGRDAVEVV